MFVHDEQIGNTECENDDSLDGVICCILFIYANRYDRSARLAAGRCGAYTEMFKLKQVKIAQVRLRML